MRSAERRATFALLDGLQWMELDAELADRAGTLARSYHRSHPSVEIADCVVAATAERLDAGLLTLNVRHFPMISGLKSAY
jgi:predicted nucleic acid-binding protein